MLFRSLFVLQAERHGWSRKDLLDPSVVYQLALRAGVSYQATCFALSRHSLITQSALDGLLDVDLKKVKKQLLSDYDLGEWYPDVWLLTESDQGTVIEGDCRDAFILRLRESSGAGYLWNIDELKAAGFLLFRDERLNLGGDDCLGGPVQRELGARPGDSRLGHIDLKQTRPWQKNAIPIGRLSFTFDLRGKESGRPRAERRSLAAA